MSDPDVLLLVLDSTRRDRVSAYGHGRETTPTLDTLASEATVFEHAYVPAPWTLPCHCSLFTGMFPSEHGVTNGFTDQRLRLSSDIPTLPEQLSERGYHTAGFSNNPWVGQLSGLDRGFEEFVEWDLEISRSDHPIHGRFGSLYSKFHTVLGHASRQPLVLLKRRFFTERLVNRASRWLQHTADTNDPTFTFMNLMEAHSPYYPPQSAFRALGLDRPTALEARRLNVKLLAHIMGRSSLDRDTRARLLEYYDASVKYLDSMVETLLSVLKREGLYEDMLLIICADHGKTLGEYDRDERPPHYVRDVNTTVPLFVKEPNQTEPVRIDQPFELHRLFETVLDGDLEQSLENAPSTALVEDFIPHTGREVETVTHWRALCDGTTKYVTPVEHPSERTNGNEQEQTSGHESEQDPAQQSHEYLFRGTGLNEVPVEVDASTLEQLRSLLIERTSQLDTATASANGSSTDESTPEDLSGSVEAQLEDLGYLD